jgi:hypothetical protein
MSVVSQSNRYINLVDTCTPVLEPNTGISDIFTQVSNRSNVPMRSDRSVVGQGVTLNTVDFPVPPVSSVSNLSLEDRFLNFMDVMK